MSTPPEITKAALDAQRDQLQTVMASLVSASTDAKDTDEVTTQGILRSMWDDGMKLWRLGNNIGTGDESIARSYIKLMIQEVRVGRV